MLKNFEDFLFESKGDYSYGCAMVHFKFDKMSELHDKIDKKDIYDEEKGHGLEDEPHITLLYGLHSDEIKDKDVMDCIKSEDYNDIILHNISKFDNDKYDVLKLDVYAPHLHDINKELTKLPHTNSFPDYHPHCTVAYLKKGTADKYIKMCKDMMFVVHGDKLIYSKPEDDSVEFKIKK